MVDVGDRLGSYEVVARLKSGGMATLYLGRRHGAAGFSRHVAIKVVHPWLAADPATIEMFVEEALLSTRIDHPNVVHVEELGEQDGTPYLVMEYVHGCSLAEILHRLSVQGRALAPEVAVSIAVSVADGLHAAHELRGADANPLGVVHRDVSPQNVLLSHHGHVTLIDFGVAKARGRARETRQGTLKGKFRYMAPEQARAGRVDRRTDVYALGIVLWEMLTGRHYFSGPEASILGDVRAPVPRPPSELAPRIAPALDAAVLAALDPDPDRRPASARELRRALLRAEPRAAEIDYEPLADLVGAVMGDELRERLRALPESAAASIDPAAAAERGAPERERTSVATLTVSSPGAGEAEVTAPGDRAPPGVALAATAITAAPAVPTATPVPPAAAGPRSSRGPIVVAALAAVLALAGAALALLTSAAEPEEATAAQPGTARTSAAARPPPDTPPPPPPPARTQAPHAEEAPDPAEAPEARARRRGMAQRAAASAMSGLRQERGEPAVADRPAEGGDEIAQEAEPVRSPGEHAPAGGSEGSSPREGGSASAMRRQQGTPGRPEGWQPRLFEDVGL